MRGRRACALAVSGLCFAGLASCSGKVVWDGGNTAGAPASAGGSSSGAGATSYVGGGPSLSGAAGAITSFGGAAGAPFGGGAGVDDGGAGASNAGMGGEADADGGAAGADGGAAGADGGTAGAAAGAAGAAGTAGTAGTAGSDGSDACISGAATGYVFTPCGGDLTGDWYIDGACTFSQQYDTPDCAGGHVSALIQLPSGNVDTLVSFGADGSLRDSGVVRRFLNEAYAQSCANQNACRALATQQAGEPYTVSAPCSYAQGFCECNVLEQRTLDELSAYSVSADGELTINGSGLLNTQPAPTLPVIGDASSTVHDRYCVDGDRLTLVDHVPNVGYTSLSLFRRTE
jgi:hypothetical protein